MAGKGIAGICFMGVLAAVPLLSGCVGVSTAQMEEYKAVGIAQMEEGDYEGAVDSFQDALDESIGIIGEEEIDLSLYKALALYMTGDAQGAIDVYTALIDFGEDGWENYYLRGNAYAKEGMGSEAAADYAEADARNPDDPALCLHICSALLDAGFVDEAQPYLATALSYQPSTGEEYYELGVICYLSGDNESARNYLSRAQASGMDESILLLGRICDEEGSQDQAASFFTSYLDLHPDDAEALGRLGAYSLESGEYEKAIDYLTRARETADEALLGNIVSNLVAAYEYCLDFETAFETAGAYLADHTDEALEREYEFLATRVGALPAEGGK